LSQEEVVVQHTETGKAVKLLLMGVDLILDTMVKGPQLQPVEVVEGAFTLLVPTISIIQLTVSEGVVFGKAVQEEK